VPRQALGVHVHLDFPFDAPAHVDAGHAEGFFQGGAQAGFHQMLQIHGGQVPGHGQQQDRPVEGVVARHLGLFGFQRKEVLHEPQLFLNPQEGGVHVGVPTELDVHHRRLLFGNRFDAAHVLDGADDLLHRFGDQVFDFFGAGVGQ
jgi:hypothetical protein